MSVSSGSSALLEKALKGSRLLYAYTVVIKAPLKQVFRFTGDPAYWARDYDGKPQSGLKLEWEGRPYLPGSTMSLVAVRKDGTVSSVGAARMELLYYIENVQISFRFLNGTHLIYSFFYEVRENEGTEFTVNVFVDGESPPLNTLRQRLYAKRRRKASIKDHLSVKSELERRAGRFSD